MIVFARCCRTAGPYPLTRQTSFLFVIGTQSPINTMTDLFRFIPDSPGKVSYGTTGPGSPQQRSTLLLAQ